MSKFTACYPHMKSISFRYFQEFTIYRLVPPDIFIFRKMTKFISRAQAADPKLIFKW